MAKRLREYTDEEIWAIFESKEREIRQFQENGEGQIVSPPRWISNLTNGVFLFHVSGGNEELTLEVWDYIESTEETLIASEPTIIKYQSGSGDFEIKMNIHVWPHRAIAPSKDDRFKDQIWASKFKLGTMGYKAQVSPQEFAEIIRYCDQISGLKAFW
jgi:hypothetical protein